MRGIRSRLFGKPDLVSAACLLAATQLLDWLSTYAGLTYAGSIYVGVERNAFTAGLITSHGFGALLAWKLAWLPWGYLLLQVMECLSRIVDCPLPFRRWGMLGFALLTAPACLANGWALIRLMTS